MEASQKHSRGGTASRGYDRIAGRYDALHARFLRVSGGAAQAAIEAALLVSAKPTAKVLDAGCGTGGVGRRLLEHYPALQLTLLDASPSMLREARGIKARRVHGSITQLPFSSGTFDFSLASWVLETVEHPARAVRELARVTRPGGFVGVAFCATRPDTDIFDELVKASIRLRGSGRFLQEDAVRSALLDAGCTHILPLPSRGPATALLAQVCGNTGSRLSEEEIAGTGSMRSCETSSSGVPSI